MANNKYYNNKKIVENKKIENINENINIFIKEKSKLETANFGDYKIILKYISKRTNKIIKWDSGWTKFKYYY